MDNQQSNSTSENQQISDPSLKSNKKKPMLIALVVIVFLSSLGGMYYWQSSKNQDLQKQLDDSKAEVVKLQQSSTQPASEAPATTSAPATPTTDEQVVAAVKAYCNASVDPTTKQALVLKTGTAKGKQVLYSSDKNYAYVNAVCSKDGTTEGSGSAYYLKKANDTWIVLYRGQMTSPEMTEQFNIPSEFN